MEEKESEPLRFAQTSPGVGCSQAWSLGLQAPSAVASPRSRGFSVPAVSVQSVCCSWALKSGVLPYSHPLSCF